MKIIAINGSPRKNFNTAQLIKSASDGAKKAGAEIEIINLYDLDKYTGCISCFGCKLGKNKGHCINRDGLTEVLEKIREADGLILGSPNYLGDVSAQFRALYERLIFQYITYNKDNFSYSNRKIPVLFIMTSNGPELYDKGIVNNYKNTLSNFIGPTKVLIAGDTKQVKDYSIYEWTMFDSEHKNKRHEKEFPKKLDESFNLGVKMVEGINK